MSLDKIIVIDGGFATQLALHVGDKLDGDPLWSSRFNATNPTAVIKTHMDYLHAGAEAILTNTYQASVGGYMKYLGLSEEESISLIKTTVKLAQTARNSYLEEEGINSNKNAPWVVASIGPYGAHLLDSSEYSGSYANLVSKDVIQTWHRPRISACIESGVEALAIETIPCKIEAEALIEMMCDEYPNVKYWISFQCKDDSNIASGENFADIALNLWKAYQAKPLLQRNLIAIGVNCVQPQYVTPLFKSVNSQLGTDYKIPLLVSPNSGELYNPDIGWYGKEDCIPLENYVPEWIKHGARIIGGCCRTYPDDIKRIKEVVQNINCKEPE